MLAAGAALVAFVLNAALLGGGSDTVSVAVARAPIASGTVLTAELVRAVSVPADSPLRAVIAPERFERGTLVATRALDAGEPVTTAAVAAGANQPRLRAMSIPIEPEHAAGGALRVGDRIDVIVPDGTGARFVVVDAEVLAVGGAREGAFGATAGRFFVTVGVDPPQALELAAAIAGGKVSVVRATGATEVDPHLVAALRGGRATGQGRGQ